MPQTQTDVLPLQHREKGRILEKMRDSQYPVTDSTVAGAVDKSTTVLSLLEKEKRRQGRKKGGSKTLKKAPTKLFGGSD